MRWWSMALLAPLLHACGLRDLMPSGPVIGPWERGRAFSAPTGSGVAYTGEPAVPFPVLPLQVWGVGYDLDLALVSRHPDWNMHEYALLRTPQGPVWLAKDARQANLAQTLVADLPDIHTWFPELPLERKSTAVRVDDRSTDDRIDVRIAYENIAGEPVEVAYEGPPPTKMQPKRNGNTMGHSHEQLVAVLDLSHLSFGRHAEISIGGRRYGLERAAGIVPMKLALMQTQGGLSIGAFTQTRAIRRDPRILDPEASAPEPEPVPAFVTVHEVMGMPVQQRWEVSAHGDTVEAVTDDGRRALRYQWLLRGDALELVSMTATQWGRATPTTHIALSPPLPDVRRRFEGRRTSRYVIDVNGQQGHAVGRVEAWWEGDAARVAVRPEAPYWTADRPMDTSIRYVDGAAEVRIARVPVAP